MKYHIKWTNTLSGIGGYIRNKELYSKEEAEDIADMIRKRGHNRIFEVVSEEAVKEEKNDRA